MDNQRRKRRSRTGRMVGRFLGPVLMAMTLSVGLTPSSTEAATPTGPGSWGPVEDWPLIAIHAALDRDGRVVSYGTDGDGRQSGHLIYDRWTPGPSAAEGHQVLPNTTRTDLFCSFQLNRADTGEMLLFGGDTWNGSKTTNTGNPDINSLGPDTGQLDPLPGMNRSRWYATGVTRPDGSIYIQGGDGGRDRPELWSPERGAEILDLDTSSFSWWYPHLVVLSDGRIFGVDVNGKMFFVSADLSSITAAGQLPVDRRGFGATAVQYRPGKILHFGGGTDSAVVIDVTGTQPVVTPTAPLSLARRWVTSTLLPDGRVLATGGGTITGMGAADDIGPYIPAHTAEVWDPRTGRWTVGSSGAVDRLYHSTALLLPDGRVLVAGGGAPGPVTNTNAELFSPDYLVAGDGNPAVRPTIDHVSATDLMPGQSVTIQATSTTGVTRVTLLKAGSATHGFNMEQRLLDLPVTIQSTNGDTRSVQVTLPLNEADVVPGLYLLTVLDPAGIPSPSRLVQVSTPTADRPVAAVDGQIVRLYQAYFLRPPDDAGYRYWRRALLDGMPLADISDQFAASPEFSSRYGRLDSAQFVDQVYANVLNRSPDPTGRAYWLDQLGAGMSRGRLMTAFSESAELVARTATPAPDPSGRQPYVGAPIRPRPTLAPAVARLYLGYFLRPADEPGLAYWTARREAGVPLSAVSDSFSSSTEFQLAYNGTSDAGFVDLVYGNVLGRPPDDAGRAYWIHLLGRGLGRGALMVQFTESAEFIVHSAPLA